MKDDTENCFMECYEKKRMIWKVTKDDNRTSTSKGGRGPFMWERRSRMIWKAMRDDDGNKLDGIY